MVEKILAEGESDAGVCRASPAPPAMNGSTPISRVLVDQARPRRARRAVARASRPRRRISTRCSRTPSCACSTPSWRASSACSRSCSAASRPATSARATIRPTGCARRCELYVLEFPIYRTYVTAAGLQRRRPRHHRPHHRRGAAALAGHRRRHLRFPARRADARPDPRRPALQPAAGAQLRAQDAAVHRTDDGEVAGGHGVLSLPRAARR